ncbi:MAG: hypothetical protein K2P73_08260 [Lachnospiraceae bacterium]|nr:hypothetical protein [Lachnospiraceae bacterium]
MIRQDMKCVGIWMAVGLSVLQIAGCGASPDNSPGEQVTDHIAESTIQQDDPAGMPPEESDESDIEQAVQHLLTVWSDHLDILEKMYASELWALDYVEAYLESGDWKDLVRARTACIASARYLSELSMTEDDLSEEEYLVLAERGIDTGYQSVEFASVPVFVDEAHNVIRNQLLVGLECDIYLENAIEALRERISAEKDSISVMSQYICITTNYLLVTLGDDAVSEPYWSALREHYPVLASRQVQWSANESELEAAADACMDRYEDIVCRQADLVSGAEAELFHMTQIVEEENLEALAASAHSMVNVPDLLPYPEWYDPHTSGYLSVLIGEDGSVTYPESGDDLGDGQYGVYMQAEGVTEEQAAAYIDIARRYVLDAWKAEDSGSWYIRMPDYDVKIDCEGEMATIFFNGEDVTFAPVWYLLK